MLKVQLNKKNMKSDVVRISYNMFENEDIDFMDADKILVTCYHDGLTEIHNGDKIVAEYSTEFSDEGIYADTRRYEVTAVDEEELYFSFTSDKYFDLGAETFSVSNIQEYVEDTDEYVQTKYLYVYFKNHHFFREDDTVHILFPDKEALENGETVGLELFGEVYGGHCIRFRLTEYDSLDCSEITDEDDRELCEHQSDFLTNDINPLILNNIEAASIMALYCGMIQSYEEFPNFVDSLNGMSLEYSAGGYHFLRTDFMFIDPTETDKLFFGVIRPTTTLRIPLFSKPTTDLNQETNVNDRFTKVEIKKAINPIDDMEKDVYSPVYLDNGEKKCATEIRFNLHFRQHRGENWSVTTESSWNGVKSGGTLMNQSNNEHFGFFSYPANKRGSQSDLLTYLGFSDSDVKYRKNKLKKTFLRLLFYDSMQPTNQNLIAYSTIFIDTGKLYGKYARNFDYPDYPSDSFGFSRLDINDPNGETKDKLSGVRTNREPYWSTEQTDTDLIESLRLSSQFVVKDKYSSDSSSEGFYLYLWKSIATKEPSDIYMKVEFNHAGYGRTIPFMLPYDDNGTKSFQSVVSSNGYSIQDYLNYSYIKLKYVYDSDTHRCLYYPDEVYKIGKDGIIEFNLYEAKLTDEGD